jgi:hypothetical protein
MYTLDAQAAKQADQTGKFIKETGKYKGRFIKAEALTASTGTQGIAFTFESDTKQVANFSIYTMKKDGERLFDFQKLMAIMTCMRLKKISDPVMGNATKYDFDQKKEVEYEAPLLRDLMNKPIGLLLQNCEYEKTKDRQPTGEYAWKIELQGCFEASTELTATEILDSKTTPEALAGMVAHLADRPLKRKHAVATPVSAGGPPSDMDDDIPFAPALYI